VKSGESIGVGAVIGRKLIITVNHVLKGQRIVLINVGIWEKKWVAAKVVGWLNGHPEHIALLQIIGDHSFPDKRFFKLRGFNLPRYIVTPKGVFDWMPGVISPGDSGSAVIDIDGNLIGLIHGYTSFSRRGIFAFFTKPKPKPKAKKAH